MRRAALFGMWAWALLAVPARAAEAVVVGAITSTEVRAAIETALEIVNGTHEPVPVLMGNGGGLDRLGGAQLRVVFADDGGDPARAAAAAERLISSEHAVALLGGASDATAAAISEVAERYMRPHLAFDPAGAGLNQRDLEWFFRIGPNRSMTADAVLRFLVENKVRSVALVSDHGQDAREFSAAAARLADTVSIKIAADLRVSDTGSLAAEGAAIAAAKAEAVVPSLDLGEMMLLVRRLAEQKSGLPIVVPGGAVASPEFLTGLGGLSDGMFMTAGFAPDAVVARPGLPAVNALFKARTGVDLSPATARALTATLLLADVIDRAGSIKPRELRIALMATDTPGAQTLMAWQGIRFDTTGQNVLATAAVQQVRNGAWATVYPETLAVPADK